MITVGKHIAPFDIDANRFCLASGSSRFTEKAGISHTVKSFKSNNFWSLKMPAIYPVTGGNLYSAKLNLRNPRDTDNAFRLTFIANPIVTHMGVLWNGSTQYSNTNLIPLNVIASANSFHMSYYSRASRAISSTEFEMGVNSSEAPVRYAYIRARFTGDVLRVVNNAINTDFVEVANTDTRGFFVTNRISATSIINSINGVNTTSGTNNSSGLPSRVIYLGGRNAVGVLNGVTSLPLAFSTIGSGLTTTELTILNSIVKQFQMILNRAVN